MKILIHIARILVGVLFIFSGLIKANDPLGLSYKMQEFFEVWNFHLLDHYSLAFSMLMIVFEILAGIAVLLGWRMKWFSWMLLLLILFFSFLTGYAYFSGKIQECGCFGNCIPLSAGESFVKDLILLALIVFLCIQHGKIRPILSNLYSLVTLLLVAVFSFSMQWYVLQHLPFIDCLPYKTGTDIPRQMKPPEGSVPDSTIITFQYRHQGKILEFTADKFPADFDDSYQFIHRYDKILRKGNAEPLIHDFVLLTAEGSDTTAAVLAGKGYKIFLFCQEVPASQSDWMKSFSLILTFAKSKAIPLYLITSDYENLSGWVSREGLNGLVILLKSDATAIKTAARADPTLYLLKKGTIINKWGFSDFDAAIPEFNALASQR
jgi:uncharacterized membrane protein YphA (DoxX/SURF4 family)